MKKKLIVLLAIVAVTATCVLTACFNFGGGEEKDTDIHVTYHLNGGSDIEPRELLSGDLTLYALWAREVTISNPSIEDLKQYLDFEITEEYTTETKNGYIHKYRQFKITASIKKEYLRLGLIVNGQIEIEFANDKNQNCGNGYFNNFTLSTLNDKLSHEGEYNVESGYTAYGEDITWKLNTYLTLRVYLPEEDEN